jgi:hypothetical protein
MDLQRRYDDEIITKIKDDDFGFVMPSYTMGYAGSRYDDDDYLYRKARGARTARLSQPFSN